MIQKQAIMKRACYFYNWVLNSDHGKYAQKYLSDRGISLKIANNFMLGATMPRDGENHSTNSLVMELLKDSNSSDIISSHLVRAKARNKTIEVSDFFTPERIIFPIIQNSIPTYFIGRSTNPKNKFRFLNMKGVPISGFFNQDVLKTKVEEIYITEGAMDALTIESMGKAAIATLGTAGIRPVHRSLFEKINKKFIFVFDSDCNGAGDKSVLKSAAVLKSFGINSIFKITLPRKEDQKKVDINQLLIRAGSPERLQEWFDKRTRQIVHVDTYMPRINDNGFEKNIQRAEIYKVASRYVDLKQLSPTLYSGKCPFHDDTEPSFYVYSTTNTFKCYGCGKWGDSSQFLQNLHNISFTEAQNRLKAEF